MAEDNNKKNELMIEIAAAFAELGYRRATSSKLAVRCGVKEQILYRQWRGKREMFVDAVIYITDNIISIWERQIAGVKSDQEAFLKLLEYESEHFAELNHYLIIFSGLSEADDPSIREVLQQMYFRIHSFLVEQITKYRVSNGLGSRVDSQSLAWAFMGIGTMLTITKHLGIMPDSQRGAVLKGAGGLLLHG